MTPSEPDYDDCYDDFEDLDDDDLISEDELNYLIDCCLLPSEVAGWGLGGVVPEQRIISLTPYDYCRNCRVNRRLIEISNGTCTQWLCEVCKKVMDVAYHDDD